MKLLLPFTLLLLCSAVLAESGSYRVEVIVLKNLAVTAEPLAAPELRSFSHFPALEPPVLPVIVADVPIEEIVDETGGETNGVRPEDRDEVLDPSAETESTEEPTEPRRADLPTEFEVVTEKSPAVEDAWRRLRGSRDYRPLLYAAWEQNRVDYYPPIRIHDQQIVDIQLRPPTDIVVAELSQDDPLAAYRSIFYQLDGTVQLRRSRFLHLHLDIEYREYQPETEVVVAALSDRQPGTQQDTTGDNGYKIYKLKQNRQIRTGRMQYFDTAHFGVLVLVTALRPD